MLLAHLLAALRRVPVLGLAWCVPAVALGTAALLVALILRPRRPEAMEDALACAVLSALGLMLLASALPLRRAAAEPVKPRPAFAPRPSSPARPFGGAPRAIAA